MRSLAVSLISLALLAPLVAALTDDSPPAQALREAARLGDLAAVEAALGAGADIEAGDRYEATALYLAARAGHLEIVQWLAERGADVNAAESFYDSRPLDTALQNGHLEVAKALLARGAESREGALAMAVRSTDLELARAVVQSGPVNVSSLEHLRGQAADPKMKELLASARSRPDPEPPPLDREQLDRLVGRFEGWTSDNHAEARREGNRLLLIVNDGESVALEPVEHGVVGMVETTLRSAGGDVEASFWGRYGSVEGIYLSLDGGPAEMLRRSVAEPIALGDRELPKAEGSDANRAAPKRHTVHWPGFRGADGDGIGDGADTPVRWNLDTGEKVRWKVELPGLGNSSPVVWGDRVFLTTAIAEGTTQGIRVGNTGSGESLEEDAEHSWQVPGLRQEERQAALGHRGGPWPAAHRAPLQGHPGELDRSHRRRASRGGVSHRRDRRPRPRRKDPVAP